MTKTPTHTPRRFNDTKIARLRSMKIDDTISLLGLYAKIDGDYQPNKNIKSKRFNISVGSSVVEIIVTGDKWFDTRSKRGGGGAIDLTMHLFKEPFVKAVHRLLNAKLTREMDSDDEMELGY